MDVAATIGCTIDELGERMSAEEFGLWLARWKLEPFGPHMLMRALAETLAGLANGKLERRDKRLWRAEDFFDRHCWRVPADVQASQEPPLEALIARFGGD